MIAVLASHEAVTKIITITIIIILSGAWCWPGRAGCWGDEITVVRGETGDQVTMYCEAELSLR